jgi:hypothetical protein
MFFSFVHIPRVPLARLSPYGPHAKP